MLGPKSVTNLEIRTSLPSSLGDAEAAAFDAAIREVATQTPEGTTRHVAFVLTWINGATFVGRVALERDRYVGLKAHMLELCVPHAEHREYRAELVELARQVRARASMADVQELLEGTRARAAALRVRTASRPRR